MTERTLESRTHFDTIDTSQLSINLLTPLPESALKDALMEVIDVTREGRTARSGGFGNKLGA